MSAFEVNITPTRLNKKRNDGNKEPTDVILAPFSARATVTFEEIPITKTALRILNIVNPSDDEIKVIITKGFKPEHNMSLEWTTNAIPAQSQITMEIVWNPLKEITCKETIQLTDNRNFKKDIVVILKAIPKPKTGVKRFPNISSRMVPVKTLKLKSPTGNINKQLMASQQQHRKRKNYLQHNTETFVVSPLFEKNDCDIYTFSQPISTKIKASTNKENVSPVTPNNISSILDNIQFTPTTEPKTKEANHLDYLASLPTPNALRDNTKFFEDNLVHPRRLAIDYSPEQTLSKNAKNLNFESTPYTKRNLPIIHTIPTEQSIHLPSGTINRTFNINTKNNETLSCSLSPNHEINKENQQNSGNILEKINLSGGIEIPESYGISSGSSRLSIIDEESNDRFQKLNQENRQKIDQTLKRDIQLVGTPLRKYSESMRDLSLTKNTHHSSGIQGSMPNLNNMEKIQSIEQNRYFNGQHAVKNESNNKQCKILDLSNCSSVGDTSLISTTSVAELAFNQSEILAASSRFNINEAGRKKLSPFILKREPQTPINVCKPTNKSFHNNTNSKYQKRMLENDSPKLDYIQIPKSINIAVSPPKRTKFNISEDTMSGVNFRTNKWGHVQPKKIRIQKTLSLVRKPMTPHKTKVEPEPLSLYNTDMLLGSYINPDPFAATITSDPFLSHSIYLDNYSLEKYESQMKKCLNALVSMPAELDPECEERVDVGKIFNEVRNKELILAPTKEEQSMTYLTKARMGALRAAASRLYVSDEMCSPCGKIAVYIKKGAVKIRHDRDLHLDVVMQRNILELLLSFNPLWLRIGLEVVFNEEIHLHSNSDIVSLSTFILNRLFKDKFMERKYSKAFTLSEEYSNHIKSFSLQKVLFLLLFLDKAKNKRIIKHNPCLFVKKSKHKETKDILLRFSSELLASVGDITKDLKRMGYVLTHKQTFIDEFDYAFNNLAVDLRDGIRLTRVMEIILLRDDLTKQLRCPAISRLQRVFNVNLGLKALSDAEFNLKGNISAVDIVDGHREKTLSLLWQIIYKFRAPKFIAAATILQKWWRNSWLKVVLRRRIQYRELIRKNKAAIKIQSSFRRYMTTKYVKIFKWERTNAAICLQKYCRRLLAMKRLKITMNSIVFIQRWYRHTKLKITERTKFVLIRNNVLIIQCWYRRLILARKIECAIPIIHEAKAQAKLEYKKAIILQRSIKSFIIHKKLQSIVNGFIKYNRRSKLQFRSAAKIQSYFKMIQVRKEFLIKRSATIKIQKYWKSYLKMRIERARFIGKRQAAIAIQKQFRSYKLMQLQRENYIKLKTKVLIIQNRFRANKLSQIQYEKYHMIRKSVIKIQQHWIATLLMRKIRCEYIINRHKIIRMQQIFRGNKEMVVHREKYSLMKKSVITIQRKYRATITMRIQKFNYEKLRSSTIIIQRKLRATLLSRKIRYEFLQIQYNVILMQERFRANCLMRKDRVKYLELKNATILIQRRFRANLLKHKEHKEFLQLKQAAIAIQQQYRNICLMRKHRQEFLKLKNATYIIQQRFRALCAMRKKKGEYSKLKKYVIFIQRKFRANKLMKLQRKEYLNLRQACILIQMKFKANCLMHIEKNKLLKLKKSAITIQQYYRSYRKKLSAKADFLQLKQSTIVIQQHFRAICIMRKIRNDYLKLKQTTIIIQQKYRAIRSRKTAQIAYNNLKQSTIIIQRQFRALIAMRQQRITYLNVIKSICIIQEKFRAFTAMKKERQEYLKMKSSAIIIQRYYRATLCMRIEQNKYGNLLLATLIIQQQFRAMCEMRKARSKYIELKDAALIIQRKYRANVLMKSIKYNYEVQRHSIILIQRKFKGYIQMNRIWSQYRHLRQAAISIQIYFRAYIQMKIQRKHFVKKKTSAYQIQRWFRSLKIMWADRNEYRLKIRSIKIIQQHLRSTLQMRQAKTRFLELKSATIKIQQIYRANKEMKEKRINFLKLKQSILKLQTCARGYLARKQFNAMITPEMKEFLRRKRAAKIIQRYWRGYHVRAKWRNVNLKLIRDRIKALKNSATSFNTVKYTIAASVKVLKGRFNVQEALNVLTKIDNMSRTVPHLLMEHSSFISTFCYGIMAQAIRSEADKQVIEYCSRIILNLAKYNSTTANTFQENGLVTIAQMLSRWCDKESEIFNTLCTLIWVFSHCPVKNQKIRKFMTDPEAIYLLRETKKLVLRKEKMRQNVRKSSIPGTVKNIKSFSPKALPSLESDFGIIRTKPYTFISSVFALDVILAKLAIKEIV